MTSAAKPPPCVGTYQRGDQECDGDSPCQWRDKCGGLKLFIAESGQELDRWVDNETGALRIQPDRFRDFCLEQVGHFDIVDGLPRAEHEAHESKRVAAPPSMPEPEPTANERAYLQKRIKPIFEPLTRPFKEGARSPRKTSSTAAAKNREDAMRLFEHFKDRLLEQFKDRRMGSGERAAIPGEMYMLDHRKRSRYLAFYCRSPGGHDVPVVCVIPLAATRALEARLPVTLKDFLEHVPIDNKTLRQAKAIHVGRFKTRIVGLNYNDSALLAQVIGKLVEHAIIALP